MGDAVEMGLICDRIAGDRPAVKGRCFPGTISTLQNSRLQAVTVTMDAEGVPIAFAGALAGTLATKLLPGMEKKRWLRMAKWDHCA